MIPKQRVVSALEHREPDRVPTGENAVDYDAFRQATDKGETPDDMSDLPSPRIGYSGLIGNRLDLELIEHLARERPSWSIVLIGKVDSRRCEDEMDRLRGLRNVHFLGQKDVSDVPSYVAALDVGLLPYRVNVETTHISPLKMYEYFAAGLPVVSTRIPSAARRGDLVSLADGAAEFIDACDAALTEPQDEARARVSEASQNTWDHRVTQLTSIIAPMLQQKLDGGSRP